MVSSYFTAQSFSSNRVKQTMADKNCLHYIELLNKATTREDLHGICSEFCQDLGFENFIYGAMIPTSLAKPSFIHITAYPEEWWQRYKNQRFIVDDPTVMHCINNIIPAE